MGILQVLSDMIVTALMLPLFGIPVYLFIILNLIVAAVIGVLTRGE